MSSTDIKDYYRRAWGLKDRPGFKYGGSWADWMTNFSDQMTFEEYLQMDIKEKKPHFLDRKAEGGVIRQNFGDGTPTKRADGQYSVRLKDFSQPVGEDGTRPRKTHIGTLEELKKIIKQNKIDVKKARIESGAKVSETKASWLKNYSMEDYEADLKKGKTRIEIARELYAKDPIYYDDLHKAKFNPNEPTALSRLTAALRGRTLIEVGKNVDSTKRYEKINKLALDNEAKYKTEQQKAHKAAKKWIKKNGPKYKKMIIPGEVTGAQSKFEKAFYRYMTDNFPRFVRYTTGTSGAATLKGLPYIDEISTSFGKKASNQAVHISSLRTELQKALGTFKEKNVGASKSFNRYISIIEKLLPTAQKNGVVDKYWTPKGGKFSGKTIPVTANNYLSYLDQQIKNPMVKVFDNLVKFSNEHIGGMSRASKILDSDALGKVVAMEYGEKINTNVYKGKTIDSNIGDALQAAMDEDPKNIKQIKKHIAVANDFADTATKKYGVLQTKYSVEVEDGKIKIKAKHPNLSLNDSLVNKTKNAISSFLANDGMKRPVFKKLPVKLQEAITLINNGKNADKVISSHLDDVIPDWKNTKGLSLKSFAGGIDLDILPPNAKAAVAKATNALGKSLKVLGPITWAAEPAFAAMNFSEAMGEGLSGKEAATYTGGKFVEDVVNLPGLAIGATKWLKDKATGEGKKAGPFEYLPTKPKFETPYEVTFARDWKEKTAEAIPENVKLRRLAEIEFDNTMLPNMTMVDVMETASSREEIEKAKDTFLKGKLGENYQVTHPKEVEVKETVDVNETDNIFGTQVPTKNLTGVDKYLFNRWK